MKRIGEWIRKVLSNRKRVIWICVITAAVAMLTVGGIEAYRILYKPQDLFKFSTMKPVPSPTAAPTVQSMTEAPASPSAGTTNAAATPAPAPVPTPSPAPPITEQKEILNVLLIGVDRRAGAERGSGDDPHADVMMVVAINFKENKVDLISLPRDTFIHAPEIMNGIYKLNASFNVGGGFAAKDGGGFLKVCEAAEYMLGGISVDYYYGVDFNSLVKLINTIGGVDYAVEERAYSRKHIKGMQHMDGLDVLFYLRTRKAGSEQGDPNRVNRQKKMMIAIFQQLKEKGKLTMIPELVGAASSGIYTNTTVEQTLALANFAKNVGADNIGMHSMIGHGADKGGWRYCFTIQKDRQEIIRKVYGFDVPEQVHCSMRYADWVLEYGLNVIRSQKTAKQLLDFADTLKTGFTAEQQQAYDGLAGSYANLKDSYDRASISCSGADNRAMAADLRKVKTAAAALAKQLGYKEKLVWTYKHPFWLDPAINEVAVDFR